MSELVLCPLPSQNLDPPVTRPADIVILDPTGRGYLHGGVEVRAAAKAGEPARDVTITLSVRCIMCIDLDW